jgi:hypothetical protein
MRDHGRRVGAVAALTGTIKISAPPSLRLMRAPCCVVRMTSAPSICLEPPCHRLRVGGAQMNVVPREAGHGALSLSRRDVEVWLYAISATRRWSCRSSGIVSGGRRPKPHSVAIPNSVTTFRAAARRRRAPSKPSVICTKRAGVQNQQECGMAERCNLVALAAKLIAPGTMIINRRAQIRRCRPHSDFINGIDPSPTRARALAIRHSHDVDVWTDGRSTTCVLYGRH